MDDPRADPTNSPAQRDESDDVQLSCQDYRAIISRLKDRREQFLQALAEDRTEEDESEGVSKTYLCSEHGATIPRGSFEMHYSWLRGEREWWPEAVGPLVEEIGRDPSGRGEPTRLFGLTPWGDAFIELLYENEVIDPGASMADLRLAVRAQSDRITSLTAHVEELEQENEDFRANLEQHIELYQEQTDRQIEIIEDEMVRKDAIVGKLDQITTYLTRVDEALTAEGIEVDKK